MNQNITIIAAIQRKDRALGFANRLLWPIKEDLQRFKRLTTGSAVIMGRKTFESIGKPLPNRLNIVVTHNQHYLVPSGVLVAQNVADAIEKSRVASHQNIFIIGGAEIYKEGMAFADTLELTVIEGEKEGDVFFPDYSDWKVASEEKHPENDPPYTWLTLKK